jgi:hypothetical protein
VAEANDYFRERRMLGSPAKRRTILGLLCCGLLLSCIGCKKDRQAEASKVVFEIDRTDSRGPLTGHVRLDKGQINIAQTLLLELQAVVEPGYEVQMPEVGKALENFGIIDWDNLGDRLDEEGNLVRTYRYRLEPFLSGDYQLPAFTFRFHEVNDPDKKSELSLEPIDVEVTSLLGEQREGLVIADIEDVVEMPRGGSLWWIWPAAGAAVAAGAGGWLYVQRRQRRRQERILKPAHEIAYARLGALIKEDLIASGRVKEFYERISSILRHYIEHRFELRAPERTTEEFLVELKYADALSAGEKEHLEEFLTHCDLVKFARHSPTTEQIQRTFDLVRDFIEKTRSEERKIDVTDRTGAEQVVQAETV